MILIGIFAIPGSSKSNNSGNEFVWKRKDLKGNGKITYFDLTKVLLIEDTYKISKKSIETVELSLKCIEKIAKEIAFNFKKEIQDEKPKDGMNDYLESHQEKILEEQKTNKSLTIEELSQEDLQAASSSGVLLLQNHKL